MYIVKLTATALVASDLGPVSRLGAVTREVTKLRAVVTGDVRGRTRFGTLAGDVTFALAVVAGDDRLLGAVRLVVTIQKVSRLYKHLEVWHAYPTSPQLKQAPVIFLGSGHSFDI